LIDYYDPLTSAFWSWSIGFADGIQYAAVGTTDLFFLPSYLFNICKGLNFSDVNILTSGATVILAIVLGTIFTAVLAICGVFTACWAIWSYAVAKIIGWMFIPTLMFDRLSFLFDGWLKFFFSALLYNIIARTNLVLVAIVLKSMIGASSVYPDSTDTFQIVVDSFQDVLGLGCFLVISILALISTGKFASSVCGGVSMGGGSLVRAAARFATKGALK
jgi:type IV secretory pathway VirB6-like protein